MSSLGGRGNLGAKVGKKNISDFEGALRGVSGNIHPFMVRQQGQGP
jgi:hypothetical protein